MNLQFWTGVKSYFALDRRAKVAPLQEGGAYELVISFVTISTWGLSSKSWAGKASPVNNNPTKVSSYSVRIGVSTKYYLSWLDCL